MAIQIILESLGISQEVCVYAINGESALNLIISDA